MSLTAEVECLAFQHDGVGRHTALHSDSSCHNPSRSHPPSQIDAQVRPRNQITTSEITLVEDKQLSISSINADTLDLNLGNLDNTQKKSSTLEESDDSSSDGVGKTEISINEESKNKTTDSKKKRGHSDKPKNERCVDVLFESTLIARFLTQTECSKFLRATPEAISYHCSKGGGICNGLFIRPSEKDESQIYGLFEGAEKHRPKERPQLNKEAVEILKSWLLSPEHMKNPYPNQSETNFLVEKTGLDRCQLKHWFNNARKRILKPYLKKVDHSAKKKRKINSEESTPSLGNSVNMSVGRSAPSNDMPAAFHSLDSYKFPLSSSRSSNSDDLGGMDFNSDRMRRFTFNTNRESSMTACGGIDTISEPFAFNDGGFNVRQSDGPLSNFFTTKNDSSQSPQQDFDNMFCQQITQQKESTTMTSEDQFIDPLATNSDNHIRTNAAFKHQVASMAMAEATAAFKDMDDAYIRLKESLKHSSKDRPEDDPIVIEASLIAKKCHILAMFKLKVSQKANEEAKNAYHQLRGGIDFVQDNSLLEAPALKHHNF